MSAPETVEAVLTLAELAAVFFVLRVIFRRRTGPRVTVRGRGNVVFLGHEAGRPLAVRRSRRYSSDAAQ